jgi:hypothetical protein
MLNLYRTLAHLRRAEPSLTIGDYAPVETEAEDVLAYTCAAPGADRFLIVLNLGAREESLDLSQVAPRAAIAVATDMQRQGQVDLARLVLYANEGLVLRLAT